METFLHLHGSSCIFDIDLWLSVSFQSFNDELCWRNHAMFCCICKVPFSSDFLDLQRKAKNEEARSFKPLPGRMKWSLTLLYETWRFTSRRPHYFWSKIHEGARRLFNHIANEWDLICIKANRRSLDQRKTIYSRWANFEERFCDHWLWRFTWNLSYCQIKSLHFSQQSRSENKAFWEGLYLGFLSCLCLCSVDDDSRTYLLLIIQ